MYIIVTAQLVVENSA